MTYITQYEVQELNAFYQATDKQLCSYQGKDKYATARHFCWPPASARYLYCTPTIMQNRRQKNTNTRTTVHWGGAEMTRKEYRGIVNSWGRNCDHFHCDPSVITKFLALCVNFNVHHSDKNSLASSDIVSSWSLPLHFLNPNFLSITRFPKKKLYTSFATILLFSGKIKCYSRS